MTEAHAPHAEEEHGHDADEPVFETAPTFWDEQKSWLVPVLVILITLAFVVPIVLLLKAHAKAKQEALKQVPAAVQPQATQQYGVPVAAPQVVEMPQDEVYPRDIAGGKTWEKIYGGTRAKVRRPANGYVQWQDVLISTDGKSWQNFPDGRNNYDHTLAEQSGVFDIRAVDETIPFNRGIRVVIADHPLPDPPGAGTIVK